MREVSGHSPKWYEPPEDPELFCPFCGRKRDDMQEVEVAGMENRVLLCAPRLGLWDFDPTMVRHVTIYQCECGRLSTENGLALIGDLALER